MRPPYSVLARRMGPGGAGAPRGARDVTTLPYPYSSDACKTGATTVARVLFLLKESGFDSLALARRRRGDGRLVAAALVPGVARPVTFRLARARHQLPVDDRVRLAPTFEPRAPNGRIDGVRCFLLGVEVADVAPLAVRVGVVRHPPTLHLVPRHAPELRASRQMLHCSPAMP